MAIRLDYLTILAASALPSPAIAQALPAALESDLPQGYDVQTFATSKAGGRQFTIIALKSREEAAVQDTAPPRPLLVYGRKGTGPYVLLARNDHVILRRDEGGASGCDPFEDGTIAIKGAYFTVEQGIACGQHWTYFVTFRFDGRSGEFVFDNLRSESWSANPSNDPDAEALVSNGQQVERARPPVVAFAKWRPKH